MRNYEQNTYTHEWEEEIEYETEDGDYESRIEKRSTVVTVTIRDNSSYDSDGWFNNEKEVFVRYEEGDELSDYEREIIREAA